MTEFDKVVGGPTQGAGYIERQRAAMGAPQGDGGSAAELMVRQRSLTEVEWLRSEVVRLNGMVERLVAQVAEMKREGFARPPEGGTVDTSQDLPQAVLDAIEERSPGPNSAVAQGLATWARRQLRSGVPEDTVAGSVLRGTDFEIEGEEVAPAEKVED